MIIEMSEGALRNFARARGVEDFVEISKPEHLGANQAMVIIRRHADRKSRNSKVEKWFAELPVRAVCRYCGCRIGSMSCVSAGYMAYHLMNVCMGQQEVTL